MAIWKTRRMYHLVRGTSGSHGISGKLYHIKIQTKWKTAISKRMNLKKVEVWIACADMSGREYFKADLTGGIGIIVGNEGNGVSELLRKKCDLTVGIPMYGKISSLNASVSAGLIMYEVVRQRKFK